MTIANATEKSTSQNDEELSRDVGFQPHARS